MSEGKKFREEEERLGFRANAAVFLDATPVVKLSEEFVGR